MTDTDSDATALAVDDLVKTYGGVVALDGVTLSFDRGTVHCVAGPNGSGKTTLFEILLSLRRPTDGRVDRRASAIGAGFQTPAFYPGLTVEENLEVFGALADDDGPAWRAELIETLRLERVRHRPASALSGGFAKKLDLALALLKRPDALLLDEPLGDLDDLSRRNLLSLLTDYAAAGNAVIVSSHRIDTVADAIDRLTVMFDGRVVLDDRTDRIALDEHGTLADRYTALVQRLDDE